jgi:polysaccharide biosynthesis/export protein
MRDLSFSERHAVLNALPTMTTFVTITAFLMSSCLALWSQSSSTGYVVGPGDNLTINVIDLDELSKETKPFHVDLDGSIGLPLIGSINAAGLTVNQIGAEVADKVKKYVRDPQVTVAVSDFNSQPVSILGAVNEPGVHQLQGNKSLISVLSLAKGLRTDAGDRIEITREKARGPIPLPNAHVDLTGQFYTAELSARSVIEADRPEENIRIMPNDVISVPIAQLVYVVGSVQHAGGFPLNERQSISVLQALSLAGGLDHTAASQRAKLFRSVDGAARRTEISVNVKAILSGKSADLALNANDVLLIPNSMPKAAGLKVLEAALQTATGVAIYRPW